MTGSEQQMSEKAFAPVIHDLAAGGHTATLGGLAGREVDGQVLVDLVVDGRSVGPLPVDPGASVAEQVRSVSGFVQDRLLESWSATGESVVWPVCLPGHHHPRELTPAGPGWPAWICPREAGVRTPVGEL